jgi:hypothetical protein
MEMTRELLVLVNEPEYRIGSGSKDVWHTRVDPSEREKGLPEYLRYGGEK